MSLERQYTPEEAAEALRLSRMTVYRHIRAGKIRASKTIAGKYLIPESALMEFMGIEGEEGGKALAPDDQEL